MAEPQYGFVCGEFSVVLSGNGVVIPGSKNAPLRKSLIPHVGMDDSAGLYTLLATCGDEVICGVPVHVVWISHESQAEPFLGFKVEDPEELKAALQAHAGKRVELAFTPDEGKN